LTFYSALSHEINFLTALYTSAPADTVNQSTAAAVQKEDQLLSLSDNNGEIVYQLCSFSISLSIPLYTGISFTHHIFCYI